MRARGSDRASRSRARTCATTPVARSPEHARARRPPSRDELEDDARTTRFRSSRTRARRSSGRDRSFTRTRPGACFRCARGTPYARARRTSRPGPWANAAPRIAESAELKSRTAVRRARREGSAKRSKDTKDGDLRPGAPETAQPTSIPPSKRMTIRATTPIRDAVSIDSTDRPRKTSLATAATIREIAGPGWGTSDTCSWPRRRTGRRPR